jgi:hypothetical protein
MRWRGAWLIATAVMAGMARAVTPTGRLDTISVVTPPFGVREMSSAPPAPAVRPTAMAGHSPMRLMRWPLRNAIAPVTTVIGSRARPVSRASRPRARWRSMARQKIEP